MHVLYGSFPPTGGLGGVRDAIRHKFGERDLESRLSPYLGASTALAPALAAFVNEELPPSGATTLDAGALAPLCRTLLRELARERPVVWVIEDLHFAPEEAHAVARTLAGAAAGLPVLVLLTSRVDGPLPRAVRRVVLPRLSPRAVIDLVRDIFRSDKLADRLGARIAHKSDGVPFFVLEMVRGLEEGQFVERGPDGTYVQTRLIEQIDVPSRVRELVNARLDDLDRDERILVDMAAVLGFDFDAELLAPVLERRLVGVLQDLAEIERRHGVVRSAGRRFRFDHHQIHEVAYEVLPPRLRMEYHGMVADAYAERLGDAHPTNRDAHFLAHHHVRGPRPDAAAPHLLRALDHLQRQFLLEERHDLAERALARDGVLTGATRVDVLLHVASRTRVVAALERIDAALPRGHGYRGGEWRRDVARESTARARPAPELDRLERRVVPTPRRCRHDRGRFRGPAPVRWCRGHAQPRVHPGGPLPPRPKSRLGGGSTFPSRSATCAEKRSHCPDCRRRCSSRERRRRPRRSWSVCWRSVSSPDTRRSRASAIGNLGILARAKGHWEQALMRYEVYVSLSREIAYVRGEVIGGANTADLLTMLGRHDEARDVGERTLALAQEMCEPRLTGRVHMAMHRLAVETDDRELASTHFDAALARLEEHGDATTKAECLYDRVALLVRDGRQQDAAAELDAVIDAAAATSAGALRLLALARRATLPDGDAAAALAEVGGLSGPIERHVMMAIRFFLWQATGDRTQLDRAHVLLSGIREQSPEGRSGGDDRQRSVAPRDSRGALDLVLRLEPEKGVEVRAGDEPGSKSSGNAGRHERHLPILAVPPDADVGVLASPR